MRRSARSPAVRYGGALAATVVATAAHRALDPVLGGHFPFATLFFAVFVVAAYAGRGPALLATGLGGALSAIFLLPPRGGFAVHDFQNQAGLVLYLAVGTGTALLGGAMHKARRRAEEDAGEALRQREQLRITLASIGDAVLVADAEGRVHSLNPVAEALTGWPSAEAAGTPLPAVFRIVNEETRQAVENPALRALREGVVVGLANHTVLVARDGTERPIDDSAAPIRDEAGRPVGAVLVFRDITEKRRAEGEVRRAGEQARMILESISDAFVALNRSWRFVYVNRQAEVLLGRTAADLIGRDHWDEYPATLGSPVERQFRRAMAENVAVSFEHYFAPHDRWYEIHADPSPDGLSVYFRDVTGPRRQAEALRESEERFRHLAGAIPQIVWIARPDQTVEFFNERWFEYTGLTAEQSYRPEGWSAAVHPDDLGRIVEAAARSAASGVPFEAEYRLRDRFGTYRWHLGRSVDVRDGQGRVVRSLGTATDIDDRTRVERDAVFLAESSRTLAAIVDEASTLQKVADLAVPFFADWCAVDMAGEGGTIQRLAVAHIDPAKVHLAHELQRRYPPNPDAPDGLPAVIRTGESRMVAEITDAMIVAGARDADHARIVRELALRSYMCVPLRGRAATLGAITFVAAESGRRYGPADLRLAEDLASRAAIAIENARLYAELKEADRRKNEFLATLAHELRNPLVPIRNYLHLLRGADGDGPMGPDRAMAERNIVHLARLIDDLMDVARISRGKIELHREVVDLADVVGQAVETARPLIDERRHELVTAVARGSIRLMADPTRLEQVFWNLLNNAAKYTEPGGRIALGVEPEGEEVVVRVRDTGIGIEPELLPRVFDMFVQAGGHRDQAGGGLGIGLSLVRTLVEMHGGSIAARSDGPGKGTEFVVRLPRLPQPAEVRAPRTAGGPEPAASPARRRILVVDDNVDAARSLAKLLEKLYAQDVRVAHDGPGALARAEEFRPEVVLLDIGLPGMDGNEVARRLRGQPEFADSLIVALTGWGQESDVERSREAGFDHHLVKPANPETIVALIATAGKRGPA